ncbi:MAG: radical SAM protein [Proteobacteria bacterium]|nr:radical SAM protein [Pseudomonadota bacterium]
MIRRFRQLGDDLKKSPFHPLDRDVVRAWNQARPAGRRQPLCLAPFTNLYFTKSGSVAACCLNHTSLLGTWPENSIREIWNGKRATALRERMRHNDPGPGCQICKQLFEARCFQQVPAEHFDRMPLLGRRPSMMEFELDTTCNLECVMCSGNHSSSIRRNREGLPPRKSPYGPAFAEQVEEFIPHLHETRFSGGEPFLIDPYYRLWENIVRLNPDCRMVVQTNGTVLTDKAKALLERGNFQLGVSLDSLDKGTYEIIRKNARFETVMENIEFFSEYSRSAGRPLNLSACPMRRNWKEIPRLVEFANSLGASLTLHSVWKPVHESLWNLESQKIGEILAYLEGFDFPADDPIRQANRGVFEGFKGFLRERTGKAREWEARRRDGDCRDLESMERALGEMFREHVSRDKPLAQSDRPARERFYREKLGDVLGLASKNGTSALVLETLTALPPDLLFFEFEREPVENIYRDIT